MAVICNVGLSVATPVPLIENVSQVIAIIGFGGKWCPGFGQRFSKLAGRGRVSFAGVSLKEGCCDAAAAPSFSL
ncbi:MAG: hypothetical protein CMM07_12005 [Rhodopirellula sp.]|nr:hypothetical protein [Rhodopirellula sp.]